MLMHTTNIDFITVNNLRFSNIGNTTAFRYKGRSEIIGLTMTNSKDNLMDGWRVCSEYSFSDQSRIVFKLKSTGMV